MGKIAVHEFIPLDGVFDEPSWTMDYPFDPKMGEAISAIMGSCKALLLGRRTFEMFAPAWSGRTAEDDPGAPFMNESPKYVVSATLKSAEWNNSTILGPYRGGRDPGAEGAPPRRPLRQWQRHPRAGAARRRACRRVAFVRLSPSARCRSAAVRRRRPRCEVRTRRDRGVRERGPASELPAERVAVSIGRPPSPTHANFIDR